MSVKYRAIHWNPQKKNYDLLLLSLVVLFLISFISTSIFIHPNLDPVNLLIRAFGSLSILLLHVVLIIGPLCRLFPSYLPLLYNRRHLGVTTFITAATHGMLSLIQFHGGGDSSLIVSLFTANTQYGSLAQFPFQVLGFFALLILFFMAATSHDFWLKNLGQNFWKRLHMLVYFAYLMVIMHVMLGVIQLESSPIFITFLIIGLLSVLSLHLLASIREIKLDRQIKTLKEDGYLYAGLCEQWEEGKARILNSGKERIAIFRYQNHFSAISNRCAHQGGPLGEGRIVDGVITCPWHGYQYQMEDGCSPPPFNEKVPTFQVNIIANKVFVNAVPLPIETLSKLPQLK